MPFTPPERSASADFAELKMQLKELADLAWVAPQPWTTSKFLLSPADIDQAAKPEQVVKIFLDHAARSVPGFQVPCMTPHTVVTSVPFAAGMFEVDEAGWVTIKLSSDFFKDRLAAHSILAHEVCHYILNNHGFRKSDILLNERYTDLCMFICGFGQIFLAGYKREETGDLGCGHRLGYLKDSEYEFAQQHVLNLYQLYEQNAPDELDLLKTRLRKLLQGDEGACYRYIKAERERNLHRSEAQLYRDVIDQLERDRR
ncbi:hypothetical protein [Nodosilinea nodulosa]|uniref:hypothetical protein n=1 Tax=Nodosilinea nodulosa TaxID=416001 RepID=UPI0012D71F40|nr:hypothetical protein [Nodosilinea nodulosa]